MGRNLEEIRERRRKETAIEQRKEGEISLGPFEVVKEIYEPYGLAPETRCRIKLKILLKTPS